METVDKEYLKGFNAGYILAQSKEQTHKDLLNEASNRKSTDNLFFKGILDGQKQIQRETILDRIKAAVKTKDRNREE